jgi:pyruvate kinase
VSNSKGLSLPGVPVSVPALTEKDEADLRFALTLRADMIALSFVRSPRTSRRSTDHGRGLACACPSRQDREAAGRRGPRRDLEAFDGLMVARGDLGWRCRSSGAAGAESGAVQACARAGQAGHRGHADARLHGSARPADAGEASDVANAVLDGATR